MLQKNRIKKLPKDVADKIAAGEVVDRPVSIVKELVENSIDAGATSIVVEIRRGGKEYIRVTDNGCGIPKADLHLAFLRHATSKIVNENDLNNINTLGFRGEALASIAAVSRVEIVTKASDEKLGSRLQIEGGNIIGEGDTGCPDGTTIIVRDLFYNTPARKKFMKQDAAESTLIIDSVSKIALAYPDIRIRLINNRTTLFSTRGKGNIYENILIIYSKEIGDRLIEVNNQEEDYAIKAFISPLDLSRSNRKGQVFFVNGRHIESKVLEKAVSEGYKERLADGRFPLAFVFLTINPEYLDVNIHPNKREVRFYDSEKVQSFVVNSIQRALYSKGSLPEIKAKHIFQDKVEENNQEQVDIKTLLSHREPSDNIDNKEEDTNELKLSEITVTGSIFGTYITGFDQDSFYLIDQHAAHERVFYEKLIKLMEEMNSDSQVIISPFVINFPIAIKIESSQWLDKLKEIGYVLEEFGPKSFIVKAIPLCMNLSEAKSFLDDFLDQIGESSNTYYKKLDKIIINACKSAVKANDRLSPEEVKELINDLVKTKNPLTCPHGRPTLIKLSKYEIEKMFKRV
ncbi:MAG: DNA mismatch repair endonuclease MutL [Clostridiales bacterium]|jgi:DNA mismatch repair protein MutL|nr:DNA mismatch repair endonuclease MutL [Clostridiales bacterium]